jgi:hypothetical protein
MLNCHEAGHVAGCLLATDQTHVQMMVLTGCTVRRACCCSMPLADDQQQGGQRPYMQSTAAVPTCRPQNAIEIALMMMSIFNLQTAETVWAKHHW